MEGTLKPGTLLRDLDLAEQLGVSRTPVREALLKLENEGFIVTKPNRSTKVSNIDFEEVYSLYSIVWTLEKLALEQGIEHIKKEQLEEMVANNRNLKESIIQNNAVKANAYDTAFHDVIVKSSCNKPLIEMLEGLKQKLKRIELFYFTELDHLLSSCEEHAEIIRFIERSERNQACSALEKNWKNGWLNIKKYQNK
ncbi:GntR family transcriptional regulator [Sporolactobacillus shoreicorticis]|nr:GntR family transcriptional regulator [Sporolactobacillus shoreicorticis]